MNGCVYGKSNDEYFFRVFFFSHFCFHRIDARLREKHKHTKCGGGIFRPTNKMCLFISRKMAWDSVADLLAPRAHSAGVLPQFASNDISQIGIDKRPFASEAHFVQ